MIKAETYLTKKLRGIKLHANTHRFIVEILQSYLEEGLEQQKEIYEQRIFKLEYKLSKRSYSRKPKTAA